MRQFFLILFSVVALFIFSSVALAQNTLAHPKKARIVARGKVETAPKRKNPAVGKKIATAPKPMLKKSAGGATTHQMAKSKIAAKKKAGRSFFWKMTLNPLAMMIWIPLAIAGIVILIRFYQLFPRREPEEIPSACREEAAEEDCPSWGQRAWTWIKEFFGRCKRKPVMVTS
jgi:hypothetical protein